MSSTSNIARRVETTPSGSNVTLSTSARLVPDDPLDPAFISPKATPSYRQQALERVRRTGDAGCCTTRGKRSRRRESAEPCRPRRMRSASAGATGFARDRKRRPLSPPAGPRQSEALRKSCHPKIWRTTTTTSRPANMPTMAPSSTSVLRSYRSSWALGHLGLSVILGLIGHLRLQPRNRSPARSPVIGDPRPPRDRARADQRTRGPESCRFDPGTCRERRASISRRARPTPHRRTERRSRARPSRPSPSDRGRADSRPTRLPGRPGARFAR